MKNIFKIKQYNSDSSSTIVSMFKDNLAIDETSITTKIKRILDSNIVEFSCAWVDHLPEHRYFGIELRYTEQGEEYCLTASFVDADDHVTLTKIKSLVNSL